MRSLLLTVFLLTSLSALAESAPDEFIEKKIKRGDWSIGGSAEIAYASRGGSRITAAAEAQYFVADNVSLGITSRLQGGKAFDISGVGVIGTYHFYETARHTYYVSGAVTYNGLDSEFYSSTNQFITLGTIGLGWNYFITPNVAFGPRLEYTRVLGEKNTRFGTNDYQLNMLLGFTLFF